MIGAQTGSAGLDVSTAPAVKAVHDQQRGAARRVLIRHAAERGLPADWLTEALEALGLEEATEA